MIYRFIVWLLNHIFERFDIGRPGDGPYLTRWTIWGQRYGEGCKVFLHEFHRGDAEPYNHDHPWPFWSLILLGGYYEHTETGVKWYGPGRLLKRPATWRHRVKLPQGNKCWTLVWTGPKERSWGFACASGWIPWRKHQDNMTRTGEGCG